MLGIAIRVDSGLTIGSGHVMRTLTLAEALRARGALVCFICRQRDGDLAAVIAMRGFQLVRLPPRDDSATGGDPEAVLLGAAWSDDADETRGAIGELGWRPAWLVVDHYGIGWRWESALRPAVERIMVIDDLANRGHDCDLLLDQNLVADQDERYVGRVPTKCTTLLGPQFALLQSVYSDLHSRIPPRAGAIRRVLLYFGGEDRNCLTRRALDAALRACPADVALDVVLTSNRNIETHSVTDGTRVTFHHDVPSLATLISRADLSLGAAGTTSWERLCLGLPAVVITRAQNQRAIAAELHRRRLAIWLGDEEEVDGDKIEEALGGLIESGLDKTWSERCLDLVDGAGARRVCDTMLLGADDFLCARHARPSDEGLLLSWANDPGTRRIGFSPGHIQAETHKRWFGERLRNVDGCQLYVIETQHGTPVGQVRFERAGTEWETHYALGPAFRGRGLGRRLLSTALAQLRHEVGPTSVFGHVRRSNTPSMCIFEALGFAAQAVEGSDVITFRGQC
jgi:UDP-2,4-diacetamido-2,4,6-trideoxy-beta-L-altropyranose hydrolase